MIFFSVFFCCSVCFVFVCKMIYQCFPSLKCCSNKKLGTVALRGGEGETGGKEGQKKSEKKRREKTLFFFLLHFPAEAPQNPFAAAHSAASARPAA